MSHGGTNTKLERNEPESSAINGRFLDRRGKTGRFIMAPSTISVISLPELSKSVVCALSLPRDCFGPLMLSRDAAAKSPDL